MAEDFRELAASLNTQLRFGRHKDALREAYRLRIHLQTSGLKTEEAARTLDTAEEVIELLERRKSGRVMRLVLTFLRSIKEAFKRSEEPTASEQQDPSDNTSEQTEDIADG